MTYGLVEGAVDVVKAYMIATSATDLTRTNFDKKTYDIQVEKNDGITLDPIFQVSGTPQWYGGEKSLESIQQYPVGFILGGGSSMGHWNNSNADAGHEVTVACMVESQDTETLRKKLYRYQRALWECIVDAYYANALNNYKILGDPQLDVSPLMTQQSRWLGECRVVVNMRKQETR